MRELGVQIDQLLSGQAALPEDEDLVAAKAAMRGEGVIFSQLCRFLRDSLGFSRQRSVVFGTALFWMSRSDGAGRIVIPNANFLLKALPVLCNSTKAELADAAFELSQRLNSIRYRPLISGTLYDERIALLCQGLLPFVRRQLLEGKDVERNIETVFLMVEARRYWCEEGSENYWNRLQVEANKVIVEWLVESSQRAFARSASRLFRSYHARELFGAYSHCLIEAFNRAHFVRQSELLEQLRSSLEYPRPGLRGYWYHWRSKAQRQQILKLLEDMLYY